MADPTVVEIALARLTRDPDVQPRALMDETVIQTYAQLYREGHSLGTIAAVQDTQHLWLYDGFHRVLAAEMAGLETLPAVIFPGVKRDAMFLACGANKHGIARTNADKRRQVLRLLEDAQWRKKSDHEIARYCGVAQSFTSKFRKEYLSNLKVQIAPTSAPPPSQETPVTALPAQALANVVPEAQVLHAPSSSEPRIVTRGKSTYIMRTKAIGRKAPVT